MTSPLLTRPGAVAATGLDSGVAWHYGDPLGEQRGPALVDRSHLGVLQVSGPDRLTWLNTLTSQLLLELPSGAWTQALVLDAHGHVEHHLELVDDGTVTTLVVEPSSVGPLQEWLQRMVFWSEVAVGVRTDLAVLTELPSRRNHLVPRGSEDAAVSALDRRLAGTWAWDAHRVEHLLPRLGVDTDERTIPNELTWLTSAVHLAKGCYRGQETVARVHNLGRPPRRLLRLLLDDQAAPGEVLLGDRVAGHAGTVVQHCDLGWVALALVRRQVGPGTDLELSGVRGVVDPSSHPGDDERPQRPDTARLRPTTGDGA